MSNIKMFRIHTDKTPTEILMSKLSKRTEETLSIDDYVGPSPLNINEYYDFNQLKILFLIDIKTMNTIYEEGLSDEVLNRELGISKEEYMKPTKEVINKVKSHLAVKEYVNKTK